MKRKVKKEKSSPILSRFFSAILVVVFFTVLVLSIVALSYFIVTLNEVNGNTGTHEPGCLLFATGRNNLNQSAGATCGFVMWGHIVIMILCVLAMAYLIFKIVVGIKLLNCFLIIELLGYTVIIVLVFCVGIVITLGLTATCENLVAKAKKNDSSSICATMGCGRCGFFPTTENLDGVAFFYQMEVIQATTWVEFGVLALAIMFNLLSICMYCYGKKKAKEAKRKEKKKALLKAEDEVKPSSPPAEEKIALENKKSSE